MRQLRLVLGGHKCGSTWLSQMHVQNAGYSQCRLKEPHYFTHYYDRTDDWYKSLWDNSSDEECFIEYSTHYCLDTSVYSKASELSEDIKVLLIVRDPLGRLISDFKHKDRQDGFGKIVQFNDILMRHPEMLDLSKFYSQISAWKDTVGDVHLLVVAYEDLRARPKILLDEVDKFFGVPKVDYLGVDKIVGAAYTPKFQFLVTCKVRLFTLLSKKPNLIKKLRKYNLDVAYRKLNGRRNVRKTLLLSPSTIATLKYEHSLLCEEFEFLGLRKYSDLYDQLELGRSVDYGGITVSVS